MYTCHNPSCKRTFNTPLKTLNLQQNPQEPYDACPYCLTKIEITNEPLNPIEQTKEETETEQIELGKKQNESKKSKNTEKPVPCNYHPGYLSERSSSEKIPDECLVCKDIVDCMLKKMRT